MPACNFVESLTALIIVVGVCVRKLRSGRARKNSRSRAMSWSRTSKTGAKRNVEARRLVTVAGRVEETLYIVAS